MKPFAYMKNLTCNRQNSCRRKNSCDQQDSSCECPDPGCHPGSAASTQPVCRPNCCDTPGSCDCPSHCNCFPDRRCCDTPGSCDCPSHCNCFPDSCCCDTPGSCDCPSHCNCSPDRRDRFYAQFSVRANPPSNSDLPLAVLFQEGDKISLSGSTNIILPRGYLYLIDFLFLATPEANGYMQITPEINGTLQSLYSFFAPTGTAERNASASGSFTTNAAADSDATLSFSLAYPVTTRNIDISGAVSVTPLFEI